MVFLHQSRNNFSKRFSINNPLIQKGIQSHIIVCVSIRIPGGKGPCLGAANGIPFSFDNKCGFVGQDKYFDIITSQLPHPPKYPDAVPSPNQKGLPKCAELICHHRPKHTDERALLEHHTDAYPVDCAVHYEFELTSYRSHRKSFDLSEQFRFYCSVSCCAFQVPYDMRSSLSQPADGPHPTTSSCSTLYLKSIALLKRAYS